MAYSLHVLGEFRLFDDSGAERDLRASKARCLLAYLAFQPSGVATREEIMTRLWSRHGREQAQTSLRQSLLKLRDALSPNHPPVLHREGDALRLDLRRIRVDGLELQHCESLVDLSDARSTLTGWAGELLADTNPRDPEFEIWRERKRYELKLHRERLITEALLGAEGQHKWPDVERLALDLLRTDPAHERAYRALMRAKVSSGDYNGALKHYATLKDRLFSEYGQAPSPETERLVADIHSEDATVRRPESSYSRKHERTVPGAHQASPQPKQELLRVAVLPLRSLDSQSREHEHLWEGIIEDVRTTLTYFRSFSVLSSSVSDRYRQSSDAIRTMHADLGVDFALEGSVRTFGERVVLNAQLVECASGTQVWGHRFSFTLDQVIAFQDELMQTLVVSLDQSLTESEIMLASQRGTTSLRAFDYWARAKILSRDWTTQSDEASVHYLRKAVEIDDRYARAYCTWAGVCNTRRFVRPDQPEMMAEHLRNALLLSERAVELDPNDSRGRVALGWAKIQAREFEAACKQFRKSLELNPYDTDTLVAGSVASAYLARELLPGIDALELANRAIVLCPIAPDYYTVYRGIVSYLSGALEEAMDTLLPVADTAPDGQAWLAATLAELGKRRDAQRAADAFIHSVRQAWAGASKPSRREVTGWFWQITPLRREEDQDRLESALAAAGLAMHSSAAVRQPVVH